MLTGCCSFFFVLTGGRAHTPWPCRRVLPCRRTRVGVATHCTAATISAPCGSAAVGPAVGRYLVGTGQEGACTRNALVGEVVCAVCECECVLQDVAKPGVYRRFRTCGQWVYRTAMTGASASCCTATSTLAVMTLCRTLERLAHRSLVTVTGVCDTRVCGVCVCVCICVVVCGKSGKRHRVTGGTGACPPHGVGAAAGVTSRAHGTGGQALPSWQVPPRCMC